MVLLTKGCCYFPLKNYAFIVGWFGCIYSVLAHLQEIRDPVDNNVWVEIQFIGRAAQFFISYKLIQGAQKSEPHLLVRWLSYNASAIFIINCLQVNYFIQAFISTGTVEQRNAALGFFLGEHAAIPNGYISFFLCDALWIYSWLCIYSLYREQKGIKVKKLNSKIPFIA